MTSEIIVYDWRGPHNSKREPISKREAQIVDCAAQGSALGLAGIAAQKLLEQMMDQSWTQN